MINPCEDFVGISVFINCTSRKGRQFHVSIGEQVEVLFSLFRGLKTLKSCDKNIFFDLIYLNLKKFQWLNLLLGKLYFGSM